MNAELVWHRRQLWLGGIWVARVEMLHPAMAETNPWRVTVSTQQNGREMGWYATEEVAKMKAEDMVREALGRGPGTGIA